MTRDRRLLTLLAILVGLVSCRGGGQLPEVVDVRELATSHGKPEVTSIIDLGALPVPRQGRLSASHRDGQATIGELLLVEGSAFGKQPTVSIGGRAAAVLARVDGGGVVVRVPWGIDPGEVDIEVSTAAGRHSRTFPIRRVGLVATGRSLWPLRIAANGKVDVGQQIPMTGAENLAISSDGAAAYVAGVRGEAGGPRLRILDLTAPLPVVVSERALTGSKVLAVCTAEQAPLALLLTDTHLQLFETGEALGPAFYNPVPLPQSIRAKRVLGAALGGQGRLLALLLADGNQVAVVDVHDRAHPGAPVFADVLPGSPLSLVQDLRFSSDEGSLWVSSGDGPRSIGSGIQPLRISLLQVQHGEAGAPQLSLHKTWELGEREAPRQLAAAHGEPIPPGTVIRPEPSTTAVYLAVVPTDWVKHAAQAAPGGAVLRSALGQGAERLLAGGHLITSLDVVGKNQVVLALGARPAGQGQLQRVVLSQRAWEQEQPHQLALDAIELPGTPPWLGEIRAQP